MFSGGRIFLSDFGYTVAPLMVSISLVGHLEIFILWFDFGINNLGKFMFFCGWVCMFLSCFIWVFDLVNDGLCGNHNFHYYYSVVVGFVLFLITEVGLFFSFFWGYLSNSFNPDLFVGFSWPPVGLEDLVVSYVGLPLINTILLLTSACFLTISHHCMVFSNFKFVFLYLIVCVLFGLLFFLCQLFEYYSCGLCFVHGIFGCSFYMLTGLHGFHVLIGALSLLGVGLVFLFCSINSDYFIVFDLAVWYWHFVDVVWIFLFFLIYFFI